MLGKGNFAALLEPGLRRIFDIGVSVERPMMQELYGIESSTKSKESYQSLGELGDVPIFDGTLVYDDFDAGYRTDILNVTLAKGVRIPRDLIDDDQYGAINRKVARLGRSFDTTIEKDAVQTFINFFTDSGTNRLGQSTNGADGVALGSLVHPDSPVQTASTQSNEGTLPLSLPNWNTTQLAMRNWTDDRGEKLDMQADTILISPSLEGTALEIFSPKALWKPGSAQFDVNQFQGSVRILVWNRLTDTNAWFAINSAAMREHLIWQWRIRPEFNRESDFDSYEAKFSGYMRYGVGFDDWRWIFGQNPS